MIRSSVLSMVMLLTSLAATAQTVQDWSRLANIEGCAGIPYDGAKETCQKLQSEMESLCKSASYPFSCVSLGTKGTIQSIEGSKYEIPRLTSELRELERKKGTAKGGELSNLQNAIKSVEEKISLARARMEANNKLLEENRSRARTYLANGQKCQAARESVNSFWVRVMERAEHETDPIKPEAEKKLREEWGPRAFRHREEVGSVTLAILRCRDCINGDQ